MYVGGVLVYVCSRGPDSSDKMSPVFPVPVPVKWEYNSLCAAPAAGISYLSNLCCNEGSGEPRPRLWRQARGWRM